MKVVEKLKLIEDIACDLQQKYTFADIEVFLAEFGINYSHPEGDFNSKRTYVKHVLKGFNAKELKKIADELDISTDNIIKTPPRNWENSTFAKAFITHIAKDKSIATRLRDALKIYKIEAFVAHEDKSRLKNGRLKSSVPSKVWTFLYRYTQKELEKAFGVSKRLDMQPVGM